MQRPQYPDQPGVKPPAGQFPGMQPGAQRPGGGAPGQPFQGQFPQGGPGPAPAVNGAPGRPGFPGRPSMPGKPPGARPTGAPGGPVGPPGARPPPNNNFPQGGAPRGPGMPPGPGGPPRGPPGGMHGPRPMPNRPGQPLLQRPGFPAQARPVGGAPPGQPGAPSGRSSAPGSIPTLRPFHGAPMHGPPRPEGPGTGPPSLSGSPPRPGASLAPAGAAPQAPPARGGMPLRMPGAALPPMRPGLGAPHPPGRPGAPGLGAPPPPSRPGAPGQPPGQAPGQFMPMPGAPAMGPPPPRPGLSSQPGPPSLSGNAHTRSTSLGGLGPAAHGGHGMTPPMASVMGHSGPSPDALAEQLEAISLGPEAPGAADATDPSLFPRPLISDGELGPTEASLTQPPPPEEPGNCDPRIMRPTVSAVPNAMSLKSSWHLPMCIVLQPLSEPADVEIPIIDGTAANSILRCSVCRSYVNPFNTWINGGKQFVCCICGHEQEVPDTSFMANPALGAPGTPGGAGQVARSDRQELTHGSVEFIAPAEYTVRPPMPPCYFFVIDVSQAAAQSGMLTEICQAISGCLDELQARNSVTKIGFITFDSAVHFYNLNSNLSSAQMLVVADTEDPFPPLPDDHYVTLEASRAAVDHLLSSLPSAFATTTTLDTAMGAALQAAYRTISHIGGKLMLFTAAACTIAAAPTKNRDAPAHYNSDREPALRNPSDPFFNAFASECIAAQICVDIFAASSQYLDLFSLSTLPRSTGGSLYFYPGFTAQRDGTKIRNELAHNLTRATGWEAVMRLRCSKGMRIATFHGHLFVRSNDLVALPSVSGDDTIVAQMQMEDSVMTAARVYVQCAVLYTNAHSERRIRVHTLALPVVGSLYDMFERADGLACAGALGKLSVDKARKARLTETRDTIEQKLSQQLQECKSLHSSHFRTASRLGYPKQLRYMLPWTHGLLRSAALRGGADVNADERCSLMCLIMTAPLSLLMLIAYPAVFQLHASGWGDRGADGAMVLPPTVPASSQYLEQHGAYLVDCGHICFVWVGQLVTPELVRDLFGAQGTELAQGGLARLAELLVDDCTPGPKLGNLTRALLALRRDKRVVSPLCFTAVQATHSENYFSAHFVEDRLPPHSGSYHDFLSSLHRRTSVR